MKTITLRKSTLIVAVAAAAAFAAGYAIAAQPHMMNALHALQRADNELQSALPDKGGHRVNAINLVNQAIGEVNAGIVAGM
jgi:hypothetical protein